MTTPYLIPSKNEWDYSSDAYQCILETGVAPEIPAESVKTSEVTLEDPASMVGFQFVPDSAFTSRSHAWPSYHSYSYPTPSTSSRHPDYPPSHTMRISDTDDVWNPLRLATHTPALPCPQFNKIQPACIDGRYSNSQYSPSSEYNGKYNFHSPDSGYGSKGTASSVATSFADSTYGSQPAPTELEPEHVEVSTLDQNTFQYNDELPNSEMLDSSSLPCPEVKCDFPGCKWTGKCPSDKRKHEARHKKLYKCDVETCTRTEGFGTLNDLSRHKKCVHKQEPERGPKVLYLCFGQNCPRRNKRWPRLDNFRQHLIRMHSGEDADELLKKSREWYEKYMKPHQSTLSAADLFAQAELAFQSIPEPDVPTTSQQEICNSVAPSHSIVPSQTIFNTEATSEGLTLNPIKTDPNHREPSPMEQAIPPHPNPIELPALKSLNLPPSLDQVPDNTQQGNTSNRKVDATVAAQNMINAMTKGMKSSQRWRRRSEQWNSEGVGREPHAGSSDRNSHVLRRIFLAALSLLPESSEGPTSAKPKCQERKEGPEKKDWFKCEYCGRQVRRQCDLNKHRKNHEKPYACTYMNCDKKFGKKIDWKCHENEDHFQHESWRCDLPDPAGNRQCCRLFMRQSDYVNHLQTEHDIDQNKTREFLSSNRIGRQGQSQYWCGFCRKIITMQSSGKERQNERFDHIDFKHFKYGQRVDDDWLPVSGHLTKREQREEEERLEMENSKNSKTADESCAHEDSDDGDSCPHNPGLSGEVSQTEERVQNLPAPRVPRNPRKRKAAASAVDPSSFSFGQQQQAPSAGRKKKRKGRSKQDPSYETMQEQFQMALSASSLLTKDDTPTQFQDFVYCCQCNQGPLYTTNVAQCIFCNHPVCECCTRGLPPAEACVQYS